MQNLEERTKYEQGIQGQLFISVHQVRKLQPLGPAAYCIIQNEKQQVRTHAVSSNSKETGSFEKWDEGFTFDVTNPQSILTVSIFATNQCTARGQPANNADAKFMGQLALPLAALLHEKPIDNWLKLSLDKPQEDTPGEIHVKMQYKSAMKAVSYEDFKPLKVVGRGAFAKVMMVQKVDTGRIYAMKVINKDSIVRNNAVKHTLAEKNVLKRLNHPFIVGLKFSFQTEDKLFMVLDYINGGELFYHLSEAERFAEERARFYTAEIVLALGYLHAQDVAYRDLKPENLLLDMDGHICLTDFGLCKEGLGFGQVTHTFCGSPEYLAPEIFALKGYDKSVDWWALGTLLYEMLSGLPPFFSEDPEEMSIRILTAKLDFPDFFSPSARSLLRGLLERDPKRRLGSGKKDAEEIKSHPFFDGINWNMLEKKQIPPPFRPQLMGQFDVRFFDPEATSEVAKHSFSKTYLTSKQQEVFRGFSFVAPDVMEMVKKARRRGSSSGSPKTPSSRKGSNDSSGSASSSPSIPRQHFEDYPQIALEVSKPRTPRLEKKDQILEAFKNGENTPTKEEKEEKEAKQPLLSTHRLSLTVSKQDSEDGYKSEPEETSENKKLTKTLSLPVIPLTS